MTRNIANDREHVEELIYSAFKNNITDLNFIDTSAITDMSALFIYWKEDFDISQWNVSNVINMSAMFTEAKNFNADISSWDVSNVVDMSRMFSEAESFNQDISSWDVSNVTDMRAMFFKAESFNQDISHWDVSCVNDMTSMFKHAKSFNADISQWNVSQVAERDEILEGATNFKYSIDHWNDSGLTMNQGFLKDTKPFSLPELDSLGTLISNTKYVDSLKNVIEYFDDTHWFYDENFNEYYQWYIYDGDLVIDEAFFSLLGISVIVAGNLTIKGSYADKRGGGSLIVLGDMTVDNIISEYPFVVVGDVHAAGLAYFGYNDHSGEVTGSVNARYYLQSDRDFGVMGDINAKLIDYENLRERDVFVEDVLDIDGEEDDDDYISLNTWKVEEWLEEGKSIFKDKS